MDFRDGESLRNSLGPVAIFTYAYPWPDWSKTGQDVQWGPGFSLSVWCHQQVLLLLFILSNIKVCNYAMPYTNFCIYCIIFIYVLLWEQHLPQENH